MRHPRQAGMAHNSWQSFGAINVVFRTVKFVIFLVRGVADPRGEWRGTIPTDSQTHLGNVS